PLPHLPPFPTRRSSDLLRAGHWQTTLGIGLKGKTLGLIGLGNLGSQVAGFGKAFGMEVLAWSQNLTAERAAAAGASLTSKEDLLDRKSTRLNSSHRTIS